MVINVSRELFVLVISSVEMYMYADWENAINHHGSTLKFKKTKQTLENLIYLCGGKNVKYFMAKNYLAIPDSNAPTENCIFCFQEHIKEKMHGLRA